MNQRSLAIIAFAAFTSVASLGCFLGKITSRNLAVFGDSPRTVDDKITDPIRDDARLAVLWVGHSTALIQLDDKFILTDPVFTDTVGQISTRLVEPGIEAEHLPPLDAVLISHVHFDHMSLGSIEMIESKVAWMGLPRGGLVYLTDFDFAAEEVGWWESRTLPGGLRVTGVAVNHNGWRYGLDRSWRTGGYTGWVIEYRGLTVYFSGDTALDRPCFQATRKRFPNIDLALLPIAPIHPRDFMHRVHTDPHEALTAFELLGARWMVPVHYETFINSLDDPGEPERVLRQAVKKRGYEARIAVLDIGEQRVFLRK